MSEAKLQKKIIARLRVNPSVSAVKTIVTNRRGVSDILCCWNGRFVAIEVKAKGKKPTKLQELYQEEVKATGGYAFVIDDFEEFLKLEEQLNKGVNNE